MSNAKHTPGPWFVKPADEWTLDGAHVQWGEYRISAGSANSEDEHYYRICAVSNVNDSPQNEANACLIVTAPELLAELREAVELIRFYHGPVAWDEYQHSPEMKRINGAIAKATGDKA